MLKPVPIFLLLIALSLVLGCSIPAFYRWTDSDQSRPSPLLWQVPLSLAVASAAFCVALPWLPVTSKPSSETKRPPLRFSLQTMLLITAGVAIPFSLISRFPHAVSGVVLIATLLWFLVFCARNPQHRLAGATLIACMILPYAWVIGRKELESLLADLASLVAGLPALVPVALLSQLFGQKMPNMHWLAVLLTALELAIGMWMICLGPKRSIAYLLVIMQSSLLGSLAFHMLILA